MQQVSGHLLADLDSLGGVLDANRGGFRTGREANPKAIDPDVAEDDRTDTDWDQTSAAALGHDEARDDEEELEKCLAGARKLLIRADDLRLKWLRKAKPVPAQASTTDPGCEWCSRVGVWSPTHREQTDVVGNLDRRYRLCSWCYGRVRLDGRLPTRAQLEAHHQGKRVRARG